jgi:hypothetical protein
VQSLNYLVLIGVSLVMVKECGQASGEFEIAAEGRLTQIRFSSPDTCPVSQCAFSDAPIVPGPQGRANGPLLPDTDRKDRTMVENSDVERSGMFSVSNAQLKSVNDFDDALALVKEVYGENAVQLASDALGDGFALTDNKDQFIGVPMVFVKWIFSEGTFKDSEGNTRGFVSARVVTPGAKYIINDGGTGIYEQLRQYTADNDGRQGGLVAQKGLRVSRYSNDFTNEGETFYIDTSAIA